MSIRYKLLTLFLLLSSISLLINGYLHFAHTKEALQNHILDSLNVTAVFKEGEVLLYLAELKTRTQDFASDGFIRDSLQQITNKTALTTTATNLSQHLATNKQPLDPNLLAIDIIDKSGQIVASSNYKQINGHRTKEPYLSFTSHDIYIKDIFQRSDGQLIIEVFAPLTDRNDPHKTLGYIVNQYNAAAINKVMTGERILEMGAQNRAKGLGKTGETYLVNQHLLMINGSTFINKPPFNIKVDTDPVGQCLDNNQPINRSWLDYRGEPVVGASICMTVGDFKWTLVSKQDESEAFAPVQQTAYFLIALLMLTLLFIALMASLITKIVLKPLHSLHQAIQIIAAGDLDHKVQLESRDEIGQLAIAFNEMITRLKSSKNRLEQLNNALYKKNKELDEFTYIASHDLQEPTRKIISFSDLLTMDMGDDLSEQAEKDLHFITTAAKRMQKLIHDLLDLSRAGRNEMQVKRFPLDQAVDRALSNLATQIKDSGAIIKRDKLPEVLADELLLTQLYQHLISNAIKFSKGDQPEIRVTLERLRGVNVFGVQDNGIGISCDFTQQIFAPFKRLHGQADYTGSGIGLAICTKAIERHTGTLWVESMADQGAHFKFLLNTQWDEACEQSTTKDGNNDGMPR